MYCALVSKRSISTKETLLKITNSRISNFYAVGGTDGVLKILNFDFSLPKSNQIKNPSIELANFIFCQPLYFHKTAITHVAFNDTYNRLTTCSEDGYLIIWKVEKGNWFVELRNNRTESTITALKWSKQGTLICFGYEDGYVLLAHIENDNIWGKHYRKGLYLIEWSPDGKNIMLAFRNYNVVIININGVQIGELDINVDLLGEEMVNMEWWTNFYTLETQSKHLMLAFKTGDVYLYDDSNDSEPIVIETTMDNCVQAIWNFYGNAFVIGGTFKDDNRVHGVSFYSADGVLLRKIFVAEPIHDIAMSNDCNVIGMVIDRGVFFGMVRLFHKWAYYSNTLVYSFLGEDNDSHFVDFWNLQENNHHPKLINGMINMTSYGDFCLITSHSLTNHKEYQIALYNYQGVKLVEKQITLCPKLMKMNKTSIVISDGVYVYICMYRSVNEDENNKEVNIKGKHSTFNTKILTTSKMRECCFFVDNVKDVQYYKFKSYRHKFQTKDPILSLCLSDEHLFIHRASGLLMQVELNSTCGKDIMPSKCGQFPFQMRFMQIGASPSSRYLWGFTRRNEFRVFDLESGTPKQLKFERKDVWNVLWSDLDGDDELTFCVLEKNVLHIVKDLTIQQSIPCNSYLAEFANMKVTIVKMELIMKKPWENKHLPSSVVNVVELNVLKEFNELINDNATPEELYQYVKVHSNKQMWEMLSSYSLTNFNFELAEKAMKESNDVNGLKFVKKIKTTKNTQLQKAEVAKYLDNYDEAQKIYEKEGMDDLANEMKTNLGQWDKIVNDLEQKCNNNNTNKKMSKEEKEEMKRELDKAYKNYADQSFENKDYIKAEEYYKKINDKEGLINVYLKTKRYDEAAKYIDEYKEDEGMMKYMWKEFKKGKRDDLAKRCGDWEEEVKKEKEMRNISKRSMQHSGIEESKEKVNESYESDMEKKSVSSSNKSKVEKSKSMSKESSIRKVNTKEKNNDDEKEDNGSDSESEKNENDKKENDVSKKNNEDEKEGNESDSESEKNENENENDKSKKDNDNTKVDNDDKKKENDNTKVDNDNENNKKDIDNKKTENDDKKKDNDNDTVKKKDNDNESEKNDNDNESESAKKDDTNKSNSHSKSKSDSDSGSEESEDSSKSKSKSKSKLKTKRKKHKKKDNTEELSSSKQKSTSKNQNDSSSSNNNSSESESESKPSPSKTESNPNNTSKSKSKVDPSKSISQQNQQQQQSLNLSNNPHLQSPSQSIIQPKPFEGDIQTSIITIQKSLFMNPNESNILPTDNTIAGIITNLRLSNRHYDTSQILISIAEDFHRMKYPPLIIKKIYTLSALELNYYSTILSIPKNNFISNKHKKGDNSSQLSDSHTIIQPSGNNSSSSTSNESLHDLSQRTINNIWHGAEAFHFYILCQSQIHNKKFTQALKTAMRLVLYEKILGTKEVYELIALTSLCTNNLYFFSKAISILEQCKDIPKHKRNAYETMAQCVFANKEPLNQNESFYKCPNKHCDDEISEYDIYCPSCGMNFDACLISGASIITKEYFKCKQCKHKTLKIEAFKSKIKNCPLCHISLIKKKDKANSINN